jgi:hypothetical protein
VVIGTDCVETGIKHHKKTNPLPHVYFTYKRSNWYIHLNVRIIMVII